MKRSILRSGTILFLVFTIAWQGTLQAQIAKADFSTSFVKPTEEYLIPVTGPNLTGEIPPLDKLKAIPLHQAGSITPDEVSGQWYDHYAYYDLGGTRVEQYTNFKETDYGQYIWLQRWRNNNGGANRWLKEAWTGSRYNGIAQWLSSNPSLNPAQEFTQGNGTLLQSYFQMSGSSCPCWQVQYTVGTH